MFVRNVAIHLKPNALGEFTRILDNEVLPILRKQTGFRDEITFSTSPTGMDVTAISGYPEVLKSLNKVLDGAPKVHSSDVISSSLREHAGITA
jgi:hypothetical protein